MSWFNIANKFLKEKKIKQHQLIELFDVDTRGAIGHYLSGRRDPSIWQLKRFSDFSGLSMDYLMTDPEPPYPPEIANQQVINGIATMQSLSENEKAAVNIARSIPSEVMPIWLADGIKMVQVAKAANQGQKESEGISKNQLKEIICHVNTYGFCEIPLWALFNISFRGNDREDQAKRWAKLNNFECTINYEKNTCTFYANRLLDPR